jgi:hypothetical protein
MSSDNSGEKILNSKLNYLSDIMAIKPDEIKCLVDYLKIMRNESRDNCTDCSFINTENDRHMAFKYSVEVKLIDSIIDLIVNTKQCFKDIKMELSYLSRKIDEYNKMEEEKCQRKIKTGLMKPKKVI